MRIIELPLLLILTWTLCGGVWAFEAAAPLPSTKINASDGAVMMLIPAGEFPMGISEETLAAWMKDHPNDRRDDFTNELPAHQVYLDAFYMYKNDVTVAQYRAFCAATGRPMPDAPRWGWQDDHPIVNVTWDDAKAYADWAGVLLPTEAQWEKAARGADGRIFPWGNDWDPTKCHNLIGGNLNANTSPVGSYPAGASPYGCLDMAGNVSQWCADWYADDYYQHAPAKNPRGPDNGDYRVLRGGAWHLGLDIYLYRCAYRFGYYPDYEWSFFGFRCAVAANS